VSHVLIDNPAKIAVLVGLVPASCVFGPVDVLDATTAVLPDHRHALLVETLKEQLDPVLEKGPDRVGETGVGRLHAVDFATDGVEDGFCAARGLVDPDAGCKCVRRQAEGADDLVDAPVGAGAPWRIRLGRMEDLRKRFSADGLDEVRKMT
jgi:hypothetical protein